MSTVQEQSKTGESPWLGCFILLVIIISMAWMIYAAHVYLQTALAPEISNEQYETVDSIVRADPGMKHLIEVCLNDDGWISTHEFIRIGDSFTERNRVNMRIKLIQTLKTPLEPEKP